MKTLSKISIAVATVVASLVATADDYSRSSNYTQGSDYSRTSPFAYENRNHQVCPDEVVSGTGVLRPIGNAKLWMMTHDIRARSYNDKNLEQPERLQSPRDYDSTRDMQ